MPKIDFKRGFTLIELLIAIFLVGLLSYFIFATPGSFKKPKERITYKNLPKYLQNSLSGDGELICINNCRSCYYISANAKPQVVSMPITLNVKNEYILDKNNNPQKIEMGRVDDKKVCMRIRHYNNNSISQVILDLGDKALFIPSYFGEGKEFDSINGAIEWWLKDSRGKLRSRGDWY